MLGTTNYTGHLYRALIPGIDTRHWYPVVWRRVKLLSQSRQLGHQRTANRAKSIPALPMVLLPAPSAWQDTLWPLGGMRRWRSGGCKRPDAAVSEPPSQLRASRSSRARRTKRQEGRREWPRRRPSIILGRRKGRAYG